jgi:transaldolase
MPVWKESRGADGRVSIEVDPRLAHDTIGTVEQGKELWALVNRPNAMIKVPATDAGLPAITELIGAGICVNVTLIFSVERYREVVRAYKAGLTLALNHGLDLGPIRSVASVFVSRIDSAVDAMLERIGGEKALSLLGSAAIANSRLVWEAFLDSRRTASWSEMQDMGAHKQRPLWASTGVKDPRFDDTRYVMDLAVRDSVNTVPEGTLEAVHDHGVFIGDAVTDNIGEAHLVWESLESLGISRLAVCDQLEADGVRLFIEAWERLRSTVTSAVAQSVGS